MARDRRQIVAISIATLLSLLAGTCYYAFPRYRNVSGAMEPTLHVGDVVFVRRGNAVVRGDLTAFHYPLEPKTVFLKRVIAVGGDLVEIRDKQVILNGKKIEEPYANHVDATIFPPNPALPEPYRSRDQFGPVKVPPDAYFMMGDNRDRSSDSRYWGFVPRKLLVGKVSAVISAKGGFWWP
jgi:signal peptidase I